MLGAAVRPALFSDPRYASTVCSEFNLIEPENSMKWEGIRNEGDGFDFTEGDRAVAFAEAHGLKVRGHALVWHLYNPRWLVEGGFSIAQMEYLLRTHIETVMGHYAGKVCAWDVVNEALDDEDGRPCASIWHDRPGIGLAGRGVRYIEQAFRWARAADPAAGLYYNDNGFGIDPKSNAIYAMLREFRMRGAPVDGVGIQMHLKVDTPLDSIAENLERLAALDLDIQITEMDVAVPHDARGEVRDPQDLIRQGEVYGRVAEMALGCSRCSLIQTWGVTDVHSWIPMFSGNTFGHALLFDARYRKKPAYYGLLRSLSERYCLTARDTLSW